MEHRSIQQGIVTRPFSTPSTSLPNSAFLQLGLTTKTLKVQQASHSATMQNDGEGGASVANGRFFPNQPIIRRSHNWVHYRGCIAACVRPTCPGDVSEAMPICHEEGVRFRADSTDHIHAITRAKVHLQQGRGSETAVYTVSAPFTQQKRHRR